MNTDDKLKLVDPNCSQLSVSRQCRLLNLSRSRFYYKPKGIDEVELEQMRILDELYLEDPTRGTCRMSKELKKLGYQCGRHHTIVENGHHALELCEEFMEYFNHKRMHSSIDDKTPMHPDIIKKPSQ